MQYKVPQDVQREDTIIGPITLKQLAILGGGGAVAYVIYVSLVKTYFWQIWLPPVVIVAGITLAFAFLKIHSLPFHKFLMNFIEYHILPRQRIWIQGTATPFVSSFDQTKEVKKEKPKVAEIKQKSLEELTNIVDTHGESKIINQNNK
ncbi:MAG: PrgI family protein [Nitrospirota bacterium]